MKLILTAHTETDFLGGKANRIPLNKQTTEHLPQFIEITKNMPITYSLGVGGRCGEHVLPYFPKPQYNFHLHYEQWDGTRWILPPETKYTTKEFNTALAVWKKTYTTIPKTIVFGHWWLSNKQLQDITKEKISIDGSFTAGKQKLQIKKTYTVKQPFLLGKTLEVPVLCEGTKATLNPFLYRKHELLLYKIIRKYRDRDIILHIGFHSYDLFTKNNKLKSRSVRILNKLKNSGIDIIPLDQVPKPTKPIPDINMQPDLISSALHYIQIICKKLLGE